MAKPFHKLIATEVAALTRSGQVSVEEYAQALIARVQERDPVVHGWVFMDPELVLASARALDAVPADKRGPLHGVAVGVKDVYLTKDMPTQYFSPIYKDSRPEIDAAVVALLRTAGALIFGKTHTTEFAACQKGPETCNPHDVMRTPGGSSSGSGAVVGDFQVPVALGTQTSGSTVRPASYNGVFAMKPTWNAVSREGFKQYSLTCDTVGLFARSVDDLELLCRVFRLADDAAPAPVTLSTATFGFAKTHMWPSADEGVQVAWEKAKALLSAAGAAVEDVTFPAECGGLPKWHRDIIHMEGQGAFLPDWAAHAELLDPWVTKHVLNDTSTTRREQLDAYDGVAALRPVIDGIAGKYTAIIAPSATGEAPVMEEPMRYTGDVAFNHMWTVLGVPVVNVPGFVGPNGMPISLSVIGPRYHDMAVLAAAQEVAKVFAKGGWDMSAM